MAENDDIRSEYLVTLAPHTSLEELSNQLTAGKGVEAVSWSSPKRI